MRKTKLSNKFLCDFTTLLYVYIEFIKADIVKRKRFQEIKEFIDGRVIKNSNYFEKNEGIKSAYIFIKKIVDYMNQT